MFSAAELQVVEKLLYRHTHTHSYTLPYTSFLPLSLALCLHLLLHVSVRYERLEDQLNDLTELHQHETSNLKQELASIEEKVAYQAYERARDIQVMCGLCTCGSHFKHVHSLDRQEGLPAGLLSAKRLDVRTDSPSDRGAENRH